MGESEEVEFLDYATTFTRFRSELKTLKEQA
jgi:hypothetical protein